MKVNGQKKTTPKKTVLFFPGKDTPLKRYVSYFPTLILNTIGSGNEDVILCHSRGLFNAIQYCHEHKISPLIVSMDGVQVNNVPEDVQVISFRPEHKKDIGDEDIYHKTIYYTVNSKMSHHPYMDKTTRNKIIRELG